MLLKTSEAINSLRQKAEHQRQLIHYDKKPNSEDATARRDLGCLSTDAYLVLDRGVSTSIQKQRDKGLVFHLAGIMQGCVAILKQDQTVHRCSWYNLKH